MSGRRQKNRPEPEVLAFPAESRSDAPRAAEQGTETHMAKRKSESLAGTERLMEEVCERENCKQALQRVKANKGSPGVDGMTVDELSEYLKQHGLKIGEQLRSGTYQPQPVRRVEIPKPEGSGMRKLGIPCVLDRFVQQVVLQVLQKRWDPTFSEHSHGFRPGRSAKQAVHKAQQYIAEGYRWGVDLDLEKFFDRVNHDRLFAAVAERVADKRMLKLMRGFLKAGVMEDGLVSAVDEGTPQGGPLSPLLSNLVLDELDRELERRGHCFVRYADDCNIYVSSERAGQRVMESVTRFMCAGINRHEAEDERALRVKTSDLLGPESCADTARDPVRRRQGLGEVGIQLRKVTIRTPPSYKGAVGNMSRSASASTCSVRRSRRPQTRLEASCTRTGRPRRHLRPNQAAGRRAKAIAARPACTSPRSHTTV